MRWVKGEGRSQTRQRAPLEFEVTVGGWGALAFVIVKSSVLIRAYLCPVAHPTSIYPGTSKPDADFKLDDT